MLRLWLRLGVWGWLWLWLWLWLGYGCGCGCGIFLAAAAAAAAAAAVVAAAYAAMCGDVQRWACAEMCGRRHGGVQIANGSYVVRIWYQRSSVIMRSRRLVFNNQGSVRQSESDGVQHQHDQPVCISQPSVLGQHAIFLKHGQHTCYA